MPILSLNNVQNVTHTLMPRDVKTLLTPTPNQKITLIVAGCYVVFIAILWHVPILSQILYPFKLLTVGFHEMSHAVVGVLTCAKIHSIEIDPNEGGATSMSGGIPYLTLPAGYTGSAFIGAALIACGFDISASKIASLVLAGFFLLTLFWARKEVLAWVLIIGMAGLIVLFWFVAGGIALRFLILFIGVMSCLYALWDIIDDTLARKSHSSDAAAFADICGCCPSQVWGFIWLVVSFCYFAAGILVGLAAFKENAKTQEDEARHFLPVPGASGGALALTVPAPLTIALSLVLGFSLL